MKEALMPSQALEQCDFSGRKIPQKLIAEMRERFWRLEAEGVHPWKIFCGEVVLPEETEQLRAAARKIASDQLRVVQACAEVLLEDCISQKKRDGMTWCQRLEGITGPQDFQRFATILRIPESKWEESGWLQKEAALPSKRGGIGFCLQGFAAAVRKIFGSHREFVAWAKVEASPKSSAVESVRAWKKPADALKYFDSLGILGEKWRSSNWMTKIARCPVDQGGIGRPLAGLSQAIRGRFGSHPHFVAWMDGKEEPAPTLVDIVSSWKRPEDALALFANIGVPAERWRNGHWLSSVALLPREGGGIDRPLGGFCSAITRRFGTHRKFVAWMDGKRKPEETLAERVRGWEEPREAQSFFRKLGIPGDEWRSAEWMQHGAKLSKEDGGIGKTLGGLCSAILKRFGNYPSFRAWMDATEVPRPWREVVDLWRTPNGGVRALRKLGVPGDSWRRSRWFTKEAALPVEHGGVGKPLHGLLIAIRDRFGSHPHFTAWMDGREEPEADWLKRVREWKRPDDALQLFAELHIPNARWRSSSWMQRGARLSIEEGGINETLSGLSAAIRERWGSHPSFVAALDGRLPFNGIQSETHARQLLRSEILRLREGGKWIVPPSRDKRITQVEWDEISKPEWYGRNPVVRAVADFFQAQEEAKKEPES